MPFTNLILITKKNIVKNLRTFTILAIFAFILVFVLINVTWLYFSSGKVKNQLSVMPKIHKYTLILD